MSVVKRRIIPTLVQEPPSIPVKKISPLKPKKATISGMPSLNSVYFDDYLQSLDANDYLKELHDRAVKRGYEKESKVKKPAKEKGTAPAMAQLLGKNDLKDYMVEFLKLKSHPKGGRMYAYLADMHRRGKYYDPHTGRFKKLKR